MGGVKQVYKGNNYYQSRENDGIIRSVRYLLVCMILLTWAKSLLAAFQVYDACFYLCSQSRPVKLSMYNASGSRALVSSRSALALASLVSKMVKIVYLVSFRLCFFDIKSVLQLFSVLVLKYLYLHRWDCQSDGLCAMARYGSMDFFSWFYLVLS